VKYITEFFFESWSLIESSHLSQSQVGVVGMNCHLECFDQLLKKWQSWQVEVCSIFCDMFTKSWEKMRTQ
jgi:hypothetical protein